MEQRPGVSDSIYEQEKNQKLVGVKITGQQRAAEDRGDEHQAVVDVALALATDDTH
jgi:hypothetical protein